MINLIQRRNTTAQTHRSTGAIKQWSTTRQEGSSGEHRSQREWQRGSGITRCETKLERVESIDIRDCIIHQGLMRSSIGTPVGDRKKSVTPSIGKTGSDTAKSVSGKDVL